MMFEASEHEPLTAAPFDESTARAFVRDVVRATDDAFVPGCGWPSHLEDRSGDESTEEWSLYFGAAGTMLALTKLAKTYDMELRHDYVAAIVACEEHAMRSPEMARRWSEALWGSSDTAIAGVALDIDAVLRRDARLLTHDFI